MFAAMFTPLGRQKGSFLENFAYVLKESSLGN